MCNGPKKKNSYQFCNTISEPSLNVAGSAKKYLDAVKLLIVDELGYVPVVIKVVA